MGRRLALIIGNSIFRDPSLARLLTPDADVGALADVLLDPEIGAFDDVKLVVNMAASSIRRAISQFFASKTRDDLLVLYFSGHGVLDEYGRLYLATKDTERNYLRGTAIPAGFITDEMDHSRSRRQVLVLDCCHSGAFARGSKGSTGASVGTASAFEGVGYGRVVLTASDATQYAWEGDKVIGQAENSVFTHYLIEGLQTGRADADGDGEISVDELYDYAYAQVVTQTPKQTPGKWSYREQGEIVIARAPGVAAPKAVEVRAPEFEEETQAKLKGLYETGLAAYWLEEWERAARAFQAIVEARPDYPGVAEKLQEARRQAELAGLYAQAQAALESQDWGAAAAKLQAVVAQEPDYKDAAAQLQEAQERVELAELYAQARSLAGAEKWQAAGRVMAEIEGRAPDYPDEAGLKGAIQENIARLERERKVEGLYSRALAQIEAGDWERARKALAEIQALQPGYAESERLLAKAEAEIERQAGKARHQAEIDRVYRQAQSLARAGEWPQALAKLEALRRLAPEFEDPDDLYARAQRQNEAAEREKVRRAEAGRPELAGRWEGARVWPQEPQAAPHAAAEAGYRRALTYAREHIGLVSGAVVLTLVLILVALNADDIFTPGPIPEVTFPPASVAQVTEMPAEPAEERMEPAEAPVIGGQASLMVVWEGPELEKFRAVLAPFEEGSGTTVEIESNRDLEAVLQTQIAAGAPPDLAVLSSPNLLKSLAEDGQLQPVDELLDMDYMQEEYDQGLLDLGTVNGRLYGVFIKTAVKSLVWYNPKVFEAAGYATPESWEELDALEEAIIRDGGTPWCVGIESGAASGWPGTDWIEDILLRLLPKNELGVYDDWASQELPWTDDTVKTAWDVWGEIVANPAMVHGGPEGVLSTNFFDSPLPMFEDPPRCYLHRQADFITDFITDQFPELVPGEDFDFFPLPPIFPEEGTPLLMAGDMLAMFNASPQSQALVQWLASAEAQSVWAEQGGYLSPNRHVDPDVYPDPFGQQLGELIAEASAARFDASDLMPSQVYLEFWGAVQDYVADPGSLEAILERLETVRTSTK